ncbi:MAG TPA: metallophosphoesterase [Saprospiraceae bacterium]|nr:metallophosphoesterase [Saprospiraceae bacterium]
MRIIQISDIHIAPAGIDTFGVDVRANFLDILEHVSSLEFDLLAITGDYCFKEPHAEIYTWIAEQLDSIRQPVYHIGGNHDYMPFLHQAFKPPFPLHDQELFYRVEHLGTDLLFLDSAIGKMSDLQFKWLEEQLKATRGPVILFTHYPPYTMGVPHMDEKYAFQQSETFDALVQNCSYPVYVFCGHYHGERIVHRGNVHIHIVPSCFFQIDPLTVEFRIEHYRIAFRTIEVLEDQIRTWVTYLPGNSLAAG